MKTTNFRLLVLIAFAGGLLFSQGCALKKMIKMAKDQQLTVEPNPLELHGDSVTFEMSALLPVKMLKKNKLYTIKTYYEFGDQEIGLGDVQFKKEDYPNSKTEQPKMSKKFSFPYKKNSGMDRGDVMIKGVASNLNGKSRETPKMSIAKGIITTARMYELVYEPVLADHGYNNQEELEPTNIEFFFPQGSSKLQVREKRSDRGEYFDAFVAEDNVTRTVTITGSHSPEGEESINTELADERAKAIEEFYKKKLEKYDMSGAADSIRFVRKAIIRDWAPFLDSLKQYDGISQAQKQKYRDIVKGPGTFEEQEDKLQDLETYDKVFEDLYPGLRFAETEILTVIPKKSDAQISSLGKKMTKNQVPDDTLNEKELGYAATLTPVLSEKRDIYKKGTNTSDKWIFNNNLAAVYLMQAKKASSDSKKEDLITKAMDQLKLANKKTNSGQVFNNMGVAALMQGKTQTALDYLDKASDAGTKPNTKKALNGMKGPLYIRQGDYTGALAAFNNADQSNPMVQYNKGLAQLMKDDPDAARSSLEQSANAKDDFAQTYYLLAVAHSRDGNEGKMAKNLSKAIKMDSSLRVKAKNDLEFVDYFDSQEFKDAIK